MLVPDEVRSCVLFVLCSTAKGPRLAGTAFLVSIPIAGVDMGFAYIVTAKHVIEEISKVSADGKIYLRLNAKSNSAITVQSELGDWVYHPTDGLADVAVLPWAPEHDKFDVKYIPPEMFATPDIINNEGIGVGDEVFLSGLFESHFGLRRNLPIVRIGNIALMPAESVETRNYGFMDAYLVEIRSIGGISGSPVFVHLAGMRRNELRQSSFYLLGLMHGHWDLPLQIADCVADAGGGGEKINSGIAIVVPLYKILEVLNQDSLSKIRISEEVRIRKNTPPVQASDSP